MNLLFSATLAVASASLTANAQLRPRDRFPITTDAVAAKVVTTFAQKGIALDARQIVLPTSVTATEQSPALEVRSVEKLGRLQGATAESTSSAVKLACAKTSICLPFYALVTQASADGNISISKGVLAGERGTSLPATPVVKSGAHITLLVESGTTHIQMAVVSMQSGALNQQIKVRSADRKQVFDAEVLSSTLVKGRF